MPLWSSWKPLPNALLLLIPAFLFLHKGLLTCNVTHTQVNILPHIQTLYFVCEVENLPSDYTCCFDSMNSSTVGMIFVLLFPICYLYIGWRRPWPSITKSYPNKPLIIPSFIAFLLFKCTTEWRNISCNLSSINLTLFCEMSSDIWEEKKMIITRLCWNWIVAL